MLLVPPAQALDRIDFATPGASDDVAGRLRAASLLLTSQDEGSTSAQDLFAAARADYGRLIGALYAEGYYSGVINILIDGREAASIAPLNAPTRIGTITVTVKPGPAFRFGAAEIAPLAPGTELPRGFAPGEPAQSGLIKDAAAAAVTGWRQVGHAKASPSAQDITADHARAVLNARVGITPGPRVHFGQMSVEGQDRMRESRIREIAGFPTGEVFDPDALDRTATRLRRTGVFRSVALTEADRLGPGDTLDVALQLVEEKRRRYGVGAEVASSEGLRLTAFWLHRNLFGGAERLTVEGEVANIGAQNSGMDYSLGVTLERPATFTPDTTLRFSADLEHLDEVDFSSDSGSIGIGATQYFSETLTGTVALDYTYARVTDSFGTTNFRNLSLPVGVKWDRRDVPLDATRGFYLEAEAMPFLGFGTTDSGARLTADLRGYYGFGEDRPFVLAGRLQAGAIYGASLVGTPRDYLFYSGGGGTVRGQPYQSLGVNVLRSATQRTGGTLFLGASAELRKMVTDSIGVVAFYDTGYVGVEGASGVGDWHSGAGLGLRYATGFGPIRLDVATPVSGSTGDGVQIYVGIGQAF